VNDKISIESDELDRTPPISVFLSAESFLLSARHLRAALAEKELKLRFTMPIYYLYSHALELTLKSFLRCKGFSVRQLASREFGHKLQVLWDACIENGLGGQEVNKAFVAQVVELLDPFAVDFEFRYVKVGIKSLPTLDAVENAVLDLMVIVRPHCEATVMALIPDRD
jgi:hypothetical protein